MVQEPFICQYSIIGTEHILITRALQTGNQPGLASLRTYELYARGPAETDVSYNIG